MEDLIKALQIFLKYGNEDYPTNCDHDVLMVNISPDLVSEDDKKILKELSFHESDCGFESFRFGSC
jgi:DNA-binding protein YbaB